MSSSTEVRRRPVGLPARKCGARKKQGGTCGKPAGWGTDHLGRGRCKLHGGMAPSGRKAAQRQELQDFLSAAAPLLDVDPIEALLYCVRRQSAVVAWLKVKVAAVDEAGQAADNAWAQFEQEAVGQLARFAKMALDAGVAERRVRMAERTGETLASALEDALAEADLPPAQRLRVARAFSTRLAVLEATSEDGEL